MLNCWSLNKEPNYPIYQVLSLQTTVLCSSRDPVLVKRHVRPTLREISVALHSAAIHWVLLSTRIGTLMFNSVCWRQVITHGQLLDLPVVWISPRHAASASSGWESPQLHSVKLFAFCFGEQGNRKYARHVIELLNPAKLSSEMV